MIETLLYFLCRAALMYGFLFTIFDAFSTILAVRNGAHEANPAWAWWMHLIGPKWVIPRIMVGQVAVWANVTFGHFDWMAVGTMSVTGAVLTWVVIHNLRIAGWWK